MKKINKGDIYLVNLDPTIGNEINKTRPGLIVSNNVGNNNSNVVIIAPISSNTKNIYPFNILLKNELKKESKVLLEQVRCIDKKRLVKYLTSISNEKIDDANNALKIVFELD